jgi:hypothetical protein
MRVLLLLHLSPETGKVNIKQVAELICIQRIKNMNSRKCAMVACLQASL